MRTLALIQVEEAIRALLYFAFCRGWYLHIVAQPEVAQRTHCKVFADLSCDGLAHHQTHFLVQEFGFPEELLCVVVAECELLCRALPAGNNTKLANHPVRMLPPLVRHKDRSIPVASERKTFYSLVPRRTLPHVLITPLHESCITKAEAGYRT